LRPLQERSSRAHVIRTKLDFGTHNINLSDFHTEEGQLERKETWIGKRTAIRRVFEVNYQRKDPSKVAHQKHFSFELTFTKLGDDWHSQIVPSWYFSYDNEYRQSHWHDELLSAQKRLEHNETVRNMVRFVAYFLSEVSKNDDDAHGLQFLSLLEFNAQDADEAEPVGDDEEDIQLTGETAA
jgi:hypothetical protein